MQLCCASEVHIFVRYSCKEHIFSSVRCRQWGCYLTPGQHCIWCSIVLHVGAVRALAWFTSIWFGKSLRLKRGTSSCLSAARWAGAHFSGCFLLLTLEMQLASSLPAASYHELLSYVFTVGSHSNHESWNPGIQVDLNFMKVCRMGVNKWQSESSGCFHVKRSRAEMLVKPMRWVIPREPSRKVDKPGSL